MIKLHENTFYAPVNVPYAQDLYIAGWAKTDEYYYTTDIQRVAKFAEHFSPELMAKVSAGAESYRESIALKPSEGFDPPVPDALKLYEFQKADVEYILKRNSTLLAEDAGLGKSAIMTVVANALKAKSVLVVCPAIAKYNWAKKEWPKWSTLDLRVGIVEANDWPENADVVIINYDILYRHKKKIQERVWDYLIVDESHRIKNIEARRTVMVLGGAVKQLKKDALEAGGEQIGGGRRYRYPSIRAKKRVFATATPLNRPIDLWTICETCDPKGLGRDREAFVNRYCAPKMTEFGRDEKGADNLNELGALMRAAFMVRHKPEEVLGLPPLREDIYLLSPIQAIVRMEEQFVHDNIDALMALAAKQGRKDLNETSSAREFLRIVGEAILNNVTMLGEPEFLPVFTEYSRIRKETGIAKVPAVIDYIDETTADGEIPLVVFGYHREVLLALKEHYPEAACIIGGMSSKARNEQVDRFQGGDTNLFLGNMDAAGEAVTLTRANLLTFAELDWRGTALIQARKRIHRISQEKPCFVTYLCAADSFDSILYEKGFEKIENIIGTLDAE